MEIKIERKNKIQMENSNRRRNIVEIVSGFECTREQTNIDLFAKVAVRERYSHIFDIYSVILIYRHSTSTSNTCIKGQTD